MNWTDWIAPITTNVVSLALLGLAYWLFKNLIVTRLKNSVKHEFDIKLEELRSVIRAREKDIENLSSGALTAMVSRQVAVDERRLKAVDQLWESVCSFHKAKHIVETMKILNFEKAVERVSSTDTGSEVFVAMSAGFQPDQFNYAPASMARPHISKLSWAIYSAYSAIFSNAAIKMEILKSGVNMPGLLKKEGLGNIITVVLPHHKDNIAKYGDSYCYLLLDELEELLLNEIVAMLEGQSSDEASVKKAEAIRQAVNKYKVENQIGDNK